MHLENTALVLEGGGMRGMFSAGVFEAFLQHELTFPYITAVSAGACNILSYMSHQPMRTRKIIENYVATKPYFSVNNYLKTGSLFGWDFIFDTLPKKLLPFDYETYANYPGELHVGTTDVQTGEAVWHYNKRAEIAFKSVIASASLPFLALPPPRGADAGGAHYGYSACSVTALCVGCACQGERDDERGGDPRHPRSARQACRGRDLCRAAGTHRQR